MGEIEFWNEKRPPKRAAFSTLSGFVSFRDWFKHHSQSLPKSPKKISKSDASTIKSPFRSTVQSPESPNPTKNARKSLAETVPFRSKSMADRIQMSIASVKFHRKNLLSMLNRPNTAALVSFALENGLVEQR
ncbi:MAG: hypothetical protein ACI80P_000582 [Flavobacteriales bacterium]|jgi:hypothetical protein